MEDLTGVEETITRKSGSTANIDDHVIIKFFLRYFFHFK